eukprot:Skav223211  [mRNA]  locus=scaffold2231:6851:12852:- [translate_table: standard]
MNELLCQADQCARKHDSFGLFDLIRRHSPKVQRRPMQLTNAEGRMATPAEELHILTQYVRTRDTTVAVHDHSFGGDATETPPMQDPLPGMTLLTQSRLTQQDLQHLRSFATGRELLTVVDTGNWGALLDNPTTAKPLVNSCAICGFYTGRIQELLAHWKQAHAHLLDGAQHRYRDIAAQLLESHHCALCEVDFKYQHTCPVVTQLALLVQNGEAHSHPLVRGRTRCEVCQLECTDAASLQMHQRLHHQSPSIAWAPARDCVPGSPACAHCGQCFTTEAGVRHHIVYNRCLEFDPGRTPHTVPPPRRWTDALQLGQVMQLLGDDDQRQLSSKTCLTCGRDCGRSQDLMSHLPNEHGELWQLSQQLLTLMQMVLQPQLGCCCKPVTSQHHGRHICPPMLQVAMQAVRLQLDAVVPWMIEEPHLDACLSPKMPKVHQEHLLDIMEKRDFGRLWLDSGTVAILQWECCFCDAPVSSPTDLHSHVMMHHAPQFPGFTLMRDQFSRCCPRSQPHDHQCTLCGIVFNVPADDSTDVRLQLQKDHYLHQCPVIAQATALLLSPFRRVHHGLSTLAHRSSGTIRRRGGQHAGTDGGERDGHIQRPPSKKRHRQPKSEENQTSSLQRWTRPRGSSEAPHPAGTPSRDGDQHPTPAGGIPPLLDAGGAECASHPDCGSGEVENKGHDPDPGVASQEPIDAGDGPSTPREGDLHFHIEPGSRHHQDLDGEEGTVGERELPIPSVEPQHQELGNLHTPPHHPKGHGDDGAGTGDTPDRADQHHPIPHPSLPGEWTRPTMEGASEPPQPGAVQVALSDVPQCRLDIDRRQLQGSLTIDVTSSPETTGDGVQDHLEQGPRQGEGPEAEGRPHEWICPNWLMATQLGPHLQRMSWKNEDTSCYINASVAAWVWALISAVNLSECQWGRGFEQLAQELLATHTFNVRQSHWFEHLLQDWPRFQEADAAEFTHHLLLGVRSTAVHLHWERRCEKTFNSAATTVEDKNEGYELLRIQLQQFERHVHDVTLQTLINAWHETDGMRTALRPGAKLTCLLIDRFYELEGKIHKSKARVAFGQTCYLPVFRKDTGLLVEFRPFRVMAVVMHSGPGGHGGHYKAMLRIHPSEQPLADWLDCNDNRRPLPTAMIPMDYEAEVVIIWLCELYEALPPVLDRGAQAAAPQNLNMALQQIAAGNDLWRAAAPALLWRSAAVVATVQILISKKIDY